MKARILVITLLAIVVLTSCNRTKWEEPWQFQTAVVKGDTIEYYSEKADSVQLVVRVKKVKVRQTKWRVPN